MNKKIKSFDEFESRFKNQELPEVHYKERQVMEHKRVPIFLRASFITLFLTLFIAASVVAAVQFSGWKLFDAEGKQVYEMEVWENPDPGDKYSKMDAKYRKIMDEVKSTIPTGEFKYFLIVEGHEDPDISGLSYLMNGVKITSVAEIPQDFRDSLHLEDMLQNEYTLKEGTLYYELPDHVENIDEEIYMEAKENNMPYGVRDGILTDKISSVELKYDFINIRINSTGEKLLTSENLAEYTKIREDGVDFLYSEEFQTVIFIKEGHSKKLRVTIHYALIGENLGMKEELLSIAKSLLQQKNERMKQ